MNKNGLNTRQQMFVDKIKEMKPANHAYAEAYNRSPDDATTRTNASRLLTNANVIKSIEEWEMTRPDDSLEAYKEYVKMAFDKRTPPNIKEKILGRIMDSNPTMRSVQQIESTEKVKFEGLNDKKTFEKLINQAHKEIHKAQS